MIELDGLDHLVLTVRDVDVSCAFYVRALGMQEKTFAGGRKALHFGRQKINLHPFGREFEPKPQSPTPGSADLCFLTRTPLPDVIAHLQREAVPIEQGPVDRTGAAGPIRSIYFRDPDGNLIEVSNAVGNR